jgi:hypothetical protein
MAQVQPLLILGLLALVVAFMLPMDILKRSVFRAFKLH